MSVRQGYLIIVAMSLYSEILYAGSMNHICLEIIITSLLTASGDNKLVVYVCDSMLCAIKFGARVIYHDLFIKTTITSL